MTAERRIDAEAERRRVAAGVREGFAAVRLRAAATALIELRELTDPGPRAAWLDQQIGSCLAAADVLRPRQDPR